MTRTSRRVAPVLLLAAWLAASPTLAASGTMQQITLDGTRVTYALLLPDDFPPTRGVAAAP